MESVGPGGRRASQLGRTHTSRKKDLEQRLRHERSLLVAFINLIPDGIYLKDTQSRFVVANPAVAQRMGVAGPEDLIGKCDHDLLPKELADRYRAEELTVIETKGAVIQKTESRTIEGSPRWFLVTKVPYLDAQGRVTGVVGVSRDITELKLHEQALTRLTRLYREISLTNQLIVRETDQERLLDGVCRIAVEEGGLLMAWVGFTDAQSPRLIPSVWYGKEEGYLAAVRISAADDPSGSGPTGLAMRERRHVFTTDIASDPRMEPFREEALQRGYRSSAAFPLSVGGEPIGALSVYAGEPNYFTEDELVLMDELAMDVSYALENLDRERRQIRTTAELEQIEEKRRLLEQQLVQAQKFESLGTLASGIAHDFNNILAIVMGHSSLLAERTAERQELAPSISAIRKAAERGAALVRQLLTFARKTESVFASVQLNELILDLVRLMRETFPKTITVVPRLQEGLPRVVADAAQLHQVFLNLCINSRDAMPEAGQLTIETSLVANSEIKTRIPAATAGEYVVVRFTDNGIGMDEETLRRAFDPFFTTKGPGKGTGLGLALAYSIIENHQGFIELESELGRGTTVIISLPVEEHAEESRPQSLSRASAVLGGSETVLVIEDEEMLLDLLNTILSERGYRVLTARDGEEGVAVYAQNQDAIAVVIADIGLPKLGGEEVFRRIQAIRPEAKVIIASGLLTPETLASLQQLGARHLFAKPYAPEEMLRKIRSVIDAEG